MQDIGADHWVGKVGGWVGRVWFGLGGWVGGLMNATGPQPLGLGWIEKGNAVRMRCWSPWVGWVGGWVVTLLPSPTVFMWSLRPCQAVAQDKFPTYTRRLLLLAAAPSLPASLLSSVRWVGGWVSSFSDG